VTIWAAVLDRGLVLVENLERAFPAIEHGA
jgi:hypothetical protein